MSAARTPILRRGFSTPVLSLLAAVGVVVAVFLAMAVWNSSKPAYSYKFEAVFDGASGITPGSVVTVAGAVVGKVEAASILQPENKALLTLAVRKESAPFRADASCSVVSTGIVSEYVVSCKPGTPGKPKLADGSGGVPRIQVANTQRSVNLFDIVDLFQAPVSQRWSIIINELGLTTAGNAEEIRSILRRGNPLLDEADQLLRTVNAQRGEIRRSLSNSYALVKEWPQRRSAFAKTLKNSDAILAQAEAHSDDLGRTLETLAPLLKKSTPITARLKKITDNFSPLIKNTASSSGGLKKVINRSLALTDRAGPLVDRAAPKLDELSNGLNRNRDLLLSVANITDLAVPATSSLDGLFGTMIGTGGLDEVFKWTYFMASGLNRYDATSHMAPFMLLLNRCLLPGYVKIDGCSSQNADDPSVTGGPTKTNGGLGLGPELPEMAK